MRLFNHKPILAITTLALSSSAIGAGGYKCVVESGASLDGAGTMIKTRFTKAFEGQEFVVDFDTGRMLGGVTNFNSFGEPKVLSPGSEHQSFKVITTFGPNVGIDYLLVREYEEGPKKPFIFVTSSTLLSGTCVSY